MLRWEEEVKLLREEMRCVLVFAMWKEGWWLCLINVQHDASFELEEGLSAFAIEHSTRERLRWVALKLKWDPLIKVARGFVARSSGE